MVVRRISNDELYHHGVKGQKWGVRRYQNPDGTLTEAGRKKLDKYRTKEEEKVKKQFEKTNNYYEKKIREYDEKMAKASSKGDQKEVTRLAEKSKVFHTGKRHNTVITSQELSALKQYKLHDFEREHKEIAAKIKAQVAMLPIMAVALPVVPVTGALAITSIIANTADISSAKATKRLQYLSDKKKYGQGLSDKARRIKIAAETSPNKKVRNKYEQKFAKQLEKDKWKYGG